MHGHLVAVEVGVESLADQRMNPDRVALDQRRFERLDPHPVQGRGTVQQHRVVGDHLVQNVPDVLVLSFQHPLGTLDRVGMPQFLQATNHERLEQLQSNLLRQTALVQLQLGTDDDHRTSRIVDPLAEQVLAKATLLALDHVGETLQRTVR